MALLQVLTFPDPVLREPTAAVTVFDDELRRLVEDMAETMYANDGVGLAAPQVGRSLKLLVLDVASGEERGKHLQVLINPEIVGSEGAIEWEEGCLSLPELSIPTRRAGRIRVRAQDARGEIVEFEAEELMSVAIQHEMDHLTGRLLVDYLSPFKRRLAMRALRKHKEEGKPKE